MKLILRLLTNKSVNEGGSMPLQWKNIYILPEHSRFNLTSKQIAFSIVEGPHHGTLTLEGQPCSAFDYSQLLSRSVIYRHDGSETTQDQLEFQIDITSKRTDFPWLDSTTYVLRIRINPVNDPPELTEAKGGHVLKISAKGSNLSFTASVPDLPLSFSIVGLPDHGVVECSPEQGHFAVCSTFTQDQVDRGLVRFRHTSSHHPKQDMFSFQVFNREAFMLNGTESGTLSRANLFAWTFPKSYPPEKLIVERGERILYPYLLNWIDDDSDGAPLQFNFYQPIKDAAVLSTVSPYHPMTIFTEKDLQQGRIMLRHLGHKNNFTISYTVSDGKHTVEGLLRVIASDPFIRLGESLLEYCCLPGDTPNLR
ncbi:unnamed protein product, partial [Strongylus vulgaris]